MIRIQHERFDSGEEIQSLAPTHDTGAVASFTGWVRSSGDHSNVTALFLEHYPGMTENVIGNLIDQARERWNIQKVRIIHRVGHLAIGEPIVFVGVASAHRASAFAACEFLMDALKTEAPFWKKEITADGHARWVEQKESDRQRAEQWRSGSS